MMNSKQHKTCLKTLKHRDLYCLKTSLYRSFALGGTSGYSPPDWDRGTTVITRRLLLYHGGNRFLWFSDRLMVSSLTIFFIFLLFDRFLASSPLLFITTPGTMMENTENHQKSGESYFFKIIIFIRIVFYGPFWSYRITKIPTSNSSEYRDYKNSDFI